MLLFYQCMVIFYLSLFEKKNVSVIFPNPFFNIYQNQTLMHIIFSTLFSYLYKAYNVYCMVVCMTFYSIIRMYYCIYRQVGTINYCCIMIINIMYLCICEIILSSLKKLYIRCTKKKCVRLYYIVVHNVLFELKI